MTKNTPKPETLPAGTSSRTLARTATTGLRLLELSLLLFLWFFYGAVINSRNLEAFNLQQAGVEAIVERRQFSLEGSAEPRFQIKVYYDGDKPFGDTFLYNGRQYAAKQPGQFMLGAVVYFFLRLFGLSYVDNYLLTSALVTFFTSSLVTALAAVVIPAGKGIGEAATGVKKTRRAGKAKKATVEAEATATAAKKTKTADKPAESKDEAVSAEPVGKSVRAAAG